MKHSPKKSPVVRLVALAGFAWFGVFLYTHAVFFKHSVHDVVVQNKQFHPAQEFLRNAKNLKKGVKARKREALRTAATVACEKTMYRTMTKGCVTEIKGLYNMEPKFAYHYIQLLTNTQESNLKGEESEHPCVRIPLAAPRSDCYEEVMNIKDLNVAKKMAEQIRLKTRGDSVTLHDAKIACALALTKANCIHDVLGVGDVEVAMAYEKAPPPQKDENGKFKLQQHHHKFTEQQAIQSCKMVHADDQKMCQHHMLKLDDEEHAEHYIHLLQDEEHHQEDAEPMTKEEANSLCTTNIKNTHHKEKCLEDIKHLPNRHMADHFIELYDDEHADAKVSQREAEKLCHHLRLSHHKHKHESCLDNLVQMTGVQAAAHYGNLLRLHKKIEQKENPVEMVQFTEAQATTLCEKVEPQQLRAECETDVLSITDWETAEKYTNMLLPATEPPRREQQQEQPADSTSDKGKPLKEQANDACQKTNDPTNVSRCVRDLVQLSHMEKEVAEHFIGLLNGSGAHGLKGDEAEHPCMRISDAVHRSNCYGDIMRINKLDVARKMAELLKEEAIDDGVTVHDAQIACALSNRKAFCIHDVLATKDLDLADEYGVMAAPLKDKDGNFILQDNHHQMSQAEAVQSCKKLHPNDQKSCQDLVLKMGDEKTAEHFIHLLQDEQYHKEDAKELTQDEASSICASVKDSQHKQQCSNEIGSLPTRHMAEHFIRLFGDQQASSLVSKMEAEKLCHHIRLSHHTHKQYESCVSVLIKMKGTEAASHYSGLLSRQKKLEHLEVQNDGYLTSAQASTVCAKVTPKERQVECQRDTQTMNDWSTAEKYAKLLAPAGESSGKADIDPAFKKDAEEACGHSILADDVGDCVDELVNLNALNPVVAKHFMGLLSSTREKNLEGEYSEHPCMKIKEEGHRAICYHNILATNKLSVAWKMAQFLKADEEHKPSVTLHDASIACALATNKPHCIHDVLGTGDLDSAEMYDNHAAPRKDQNGKLALEAHHHRMSKAEAEQACKLVHPDDQEKCQKHVLTMDDEGIAMHYIHLLQDVEHHLDTTSAISESEAQSICAPIKSSKHHKQCLSDVHMLPNEHIAEHLRDLYDDQHASKKVTKETAQQLCNHLRLSKKHNNHDSCVDHLTGITGVEAAAHCSKLLQRQHLNDQKANPASVVLTPVQAKSICGDLKPHQLAEECRRDVLTLNDVVIAQSYANHFATHMKAEKPQEGDEANETNGKDDILKEAETACYRTIHPDDVKECIQELRRMAFMDEKIAKHFIQLLLTSTEENLESKEAEHPCLIIDLEKYRLECYHDVLATNDLVVAKEIAQLMNAKVEGDASGDVTLHDASIACALAVQKALCIHDVLGTKDIDIAESYEKHAAPKQDEKGQMKLQSHHHKLGDPDAEQACKILNNKDDRANCKEHVLTMDDPSTAEHYIHLLLDTEHHSDTDPTSTVGEDGAKSLCAPIKNAQSNQQCLDDVSSLPNEHIAGHLIPLYDDQLASKVIPKKEAEKLCNHLMLSQEQLGQESCIKFLTKTKGLEAAAHVSRIFQKSRAAKAAKADGAKTEKKLLTKSESESVCKAIKEKGDKKECVRATLTMNDIDVAQRFADLVAGTV